MQLSLRKKYSKVHPFERARKIWDIGMMYEVPWR